MMDWIPHSVQFDAPTDDNKPRFSLPFASEGNISTANDMENDQFALSNHKICKSALGHILNFKHHRWLNLKKAVQNDESMTHGDRNRLSHDAIKFNKLVQDDLHVFFDNLQELASTTSTRLVREETGLGLRDGEEGVIELPPSFSE